MPAGGAWASNPDPLHYLATLGRRPAALDTCQRLSALALAAAGECVATWSAARRARRHGGSARVLQLLADPVEQVEHRQTRRRPARLPRRSHSGTPPPPRRKGAPQTHQQMIYGPLPSAVPGLQVHASQSASFDSLLSGEGWRESPIESAAGENQPEQLRLPTIHASSRSWPGKSSPPTRATAIRLTELEVAARATNVLTARIKQAAFPTAARRTSDSRLRRCLPSVSRRSWSWRNNEARRYNCCLISNARAPAKRTSPSPSDWPPAGWASRMRFFTRHTLVNRLEESQKQYQLERFLKQLDKLELLICDELGYLRSIAWSRAVVPGICRSLRTIQSADHQQLAVQRVAAGVPRGADDSRSLGPADAPLRNL